MRRFAVIFQATVVVATAVLLAAVLGAMPALAQQTQGRRAPNVVYFIIDELGYYELSGLGHPVHRTPNIDRMMNEGMRFTQCLAGSAVCAPTRCVLMTGKHSGHTSVRSNGGSLPLREGEATLASMLKQEGYATGGFGKWGCGGRGTSGVPEKHGFDLFFGYYDQTHAHTYFPKYLVRNSAEVPLAGNTGDPYHGETFSQYVIFDQAKKFIREHKDQPFFAYLCWTPPHGLWGFPKSDPSWALYQDQPWTGGMGSDQDGKVYAAMVNLIDREVGDVLSLLKELQLDDNTVVFFSGDNGANRYFPDDSHPDGLFSPNVDPRTGKKFRGYKGQLYEGGLRVPFIARWPGKIKAGAVSDHLGFFGDVMPTLAELTGASCPADTDGISLAPTLLGEQAAGHKQGQHKYLYWELTGQTAVREGTWKAVHNKGPKATWELYDLSTDISESNDLAKEQPDVLARLVAYATEAHTPEAIGVIYDQAVLEKDRNYFEGRNYWKQPLKTSQK